MCGCKDIVFFYNWLEFVFVFYVFLCGVAWVEVLHACGDARAVRILGV